NSSATLRAFLWGRNWRITLIRAAVWVGICFLIFKVLLVHIEVIGISMLPTYKEHSKNWINRLAYVWHEPQRGDIVGIRLVPENSGVVNQLIVRFKTPPHFLLLKRIVGLPGETVAFSRGRILINGKVLKEPYETLNCDWNIGPITLGADEYFVVGDNRTMPEQDHTKGHCKRSQIIGKVL